MYSKHVWSAHVAGGCAAGWDVITTNVFATKRFQSIIDRLITLPEHNRQVSNTFVYVCTRVRAQLCVVSVRA